MLKNESLNQFIEELIQEIESELDESNVTGNIDGYDTPHAFSGKNASNRRKKTATQLGYTLVNGDVTNIDESINEEKVYIDFLNKKKGFKQDRIKFNSYEEAVKWARKNFDKFNPDMIKYESINELTANEKRIKDGNPANVYYAFYKGKFEAVYWAMNPSDLFKIYWDEFKVRRPAGSQFKLNPEFVIVPKKQYDKNPNQYSKLKPYVDRFWDRLKNESVNEGKSKRPVNRWLELKNDESVHAHKKLAMGLKELKYQLAEVEKFFTWYNKIKNINELDSSDYWKRTNSHIYKIKERLINIARTLQEIEK